MPRGGKRLWGDDGDLAVVKAYMSGETSTSISRRLGCDKSTVLDALRRHGTPIRDGGKARRLELDARRDEIVAMYRSGQSAWSIKRALGCSSGNPINRILREAGIVIERRPIVGAQHHMWKGGHHLDQAGYRRIKLRKSDPFYQMCSPNGYVMEHRLVMAKSIGRLLERYETVHHIDGNRQNNDLSNLELHQSRHGAGIRMRCRDCGSHNVEAVALTAGES